MTFPWEEQLPAVTEPVRPPAVRPVEETVAALQRDFAYAVMYTAVLVHSEHAALQMCVNTARGQIIPRGACKFTDGSSFELQDLGMPQPNTPTMSVKELVSRVWNVASELGLELAP